MKSESRARKERGVAAKRLWPRIPEVVEAVILHDYVGQEKPVTLEAVSDSRRLAECGLAGVALRMRLSGSLNLESDAFERMRSAHFAYMQRATVTLKESMDAIRVLRTRGVPFAISKGPGVALACRGGVGMRPFGDLDILVEPCRYSGAMRMLEEMGYREEEKSRLPWRWCDRVCREAVNLHSASGGSVDLHHHVPPWLWARSVDVGYLISLAQWVSVGAGSLPLLPPEANLLIIALHIVSDRNRPGENLMAWRDLLTLAEVADTRAVLALAERFGLVAWLRWVLSEVPRLARPRDLWSTLELTSSRLRHRSRLGALMPPGVASENIIGQALRLPTPNAMAYVSAMMFPSREFLLSHGYSGVSARIRWQIDAAKSVQRARVLTSEKVGRGGGTRTCRVSTDGG